MRTLLPNATLAATLVFAAGPGLCERPAGPAFAGDAGSGEAIYRYYCYQCHGYAGDARTQASASLSPPPRDFTAATPGELPVERIVATVLGGRPGTGMVSFASVLDRAQAEAVARYVQDAFMSREPVEARYHSPENGWTDHDRYRDAWPWVTGERSLDTPWEDLDGAGRRGRRLYEAACVSCHDQPLSAPADDTVWETRAVSWPRRHYSHRLEATDLVSGASPYARHDVAPDLPALTPTERDGKRLYEDNCAFCHAADGTGRNWIGSFLDPKPRDFTAPGFALLGETAALDARIRAGIPGTSMPAWEAVLSDAEIDAVIAYLRAAFGPGAPPGAAAAGQ